MSPIPTATIVKHSERTVRKGCRTCKRNDLYWGHDTSRDSHLHCSKCSTNLNTEIGGKWVMIERDGTLHGCFANGNDQTPGIDVAPTLDQTASEPEQVASVLPKPSVVGSKPAAFGGVSTADNAAQAADLLGQLGKLMSPGLDTGQVESIVMDLLDKHRKDIVDVVGQVITDRINKLTMPNTVQVKHADGHVTMPKGAVHKIMADVLKLVGQRYHVLMVGPAGTGKSKIASQVAEALELDYSEISLSPDRSTSALLGYMDATGNYVETEFRKRFALGGVMHFDEMDNAHPSVLAVINAGLANGHMAFPDGMVKRHADFVCVASANTYGLGPDRAYVGRQAIDKATLNRFLVIPVGYDEALERMICLSSGLPEIKVDRVLTWIRALRKNVMDHKLPVVVGTRNARHLCGALHAGIRLSDAIEYAVRCGMSDSDWGRVTNGVTPLAHV